MNCNSICFFVCIDFYYSDLLFFFFTSVVFFSFLFFIPLKHFDIIALVYYLLCYFLRPHCYMLQSYAAYNIYIFYLLTDLLFNYNVFKVSC